MREYWIYQASQGFDHHLETELTRLGPWEKVAEGLYRGPVTPQPPVWVQNIWTSPEELPFHSIKEAAKLLRERSGLWVPVLTQFHRRGALIQELLPRLRNKPKAFGSPLPSGTLGAWTLLDENTLLVSKTTTSPFPAGEALFQEDKENPPSSAYLKLWEAFTLTKTWAAQKQNSSGTGELPCPGSEDLCLDAGACPGGWTWVLAGLGARVKAVDRSPLEKGLENHPLVSFQTGDGFKITPDRVKREGWEPFTWILSDMAAFPAKVWDWVGLWRESDPALKFVITLKMQGEPDWETMDRFRQIPGSRLIKLYNNKHEVTWLKV